VIVLLIPTLVFIFFRIHHHYKSVAKALSMDSGIRPDGDPRSVQTLILVDKVHAETVRMVNFAKSLNHPWKAIHVGVNPDAVKETQTRWAQRIGEGELVILDSPFRQLSEPVQEYIEKLQAENSGC